MNIPLYFFISLGVAVLGFVIAALNMLTLPRRASKGSAMSIFVVHIIAGLFYGLGFLGMIEFGVVWIVTYLKA